MIQINKFADEQRPKVVSYIRRKFPTVDADSCFQEGFIAMWQNIKSGKLDVDNMSGSLGTYLMACCINWARNQVRGGVKTSLMGELADIVEGGLDDIDDIEDDDPLKDAKIRVLELLEKLVSDLQSPCKELIWGHYRDKYKDAIQATRLGYLSAMVVKTTRNRCMNKLRKQVNELIELSKEE